MSQQVTTHVAHAAPSIPDYELLRPIGRGAYGEVWLARNVTGSWVALKIVHRSAFDHDRPFEREFEGIKRFEPISRSDPSQVAILHVGLGEGFFYYVMELADDANVGQASSLSGASGDSSTETGKMPVLLYTPKTLKRLLNDRGALPAQECVAIALSLTHALAHLHGHGLVHRDVKPSNVIFVNGQAKLADIGLVTSVDATRSFVGTEGYLPPEGAGTPQADLYSLGKVLYEMSTGCNRKEFPALPPDIATRPDRDALAELNAIVVRACQLDSRQRFASAEAMLADLQLLQCGKSVKRKRTVQQRWAIGKSAGLVVILLALVGISAKFALTGLTRNRPLSSNPGAENLYRQSVYLLQSMTLERTREAFTNLAEAVKLDPDFADAYYMLFEAYFGVLGDKLPPHYDEKANINAVAVKLKELRPNSAQYHTVNSLIRFKDWKFDEAIEEVRLAIKSDPAFLRAHGLYAWYMLLARGDAATALREYRIAERIDPSDMIIQYSLGGVFYFDRKYDQAIEQYTKAIKLEPRQSLAHYFLGRAYEGNRQYDKAIDEYEMTAAAMGADGVETRAKYDKQRATLRDEGPRGWWQARLDEARQSSSPDPYSTAALCARLGYTNEVFPLLERAYKEHDGGMIQLLEDDIWDSLRNDERFQDIIKRMRLGQK